MDLQQVGKLVFRARVEKKLTQQQLADAAQVSRRWVNMLENGKLVDIGYVRLQAITSAIGLEVFVDRNIKAKDAWI